MSALKFEDLDLKLIPMEKPSAPPAKLPLALAHLKSGAKQIRLSAKAREALGHPQFVQVLANNGCVAIRASKKDDQHSRPVAKSGAVTAIEILRAFGVSQGERVPLLGTVDSGHLIAQIPDRPVNGSKS